MTSGRARRMLPLVVAALAVVLLLPARAPADGDGDRAEARQTRGCTRSSQVTLRLRAKDDTIRVELEIDAERHGSRWFVILLHERRIVFEGTLRAERSSRSLKLRRTVPDWFGRDSVVARATGPREEICRVSVQV